MFITAESSTSMDQKPTPETPAVVVTSRGVSLADKLRLSELPLATTPGGKSFALKALHPSEHTIKSARVPGGNALSVALCCDMVQTIPITSANSSTRIVLMPSVITPASVEVRDGENFTFANFYNAAFGGVYKVSPDYTHTRAFVASLTGKIEHYRITSQSATVELIAPALSDQGTVTAAQYRIAPRTSEYTSSTDGVTALVHPDIAIWPEPVSTSSLVLGTSAYTSKARDGVYMPLKLTKFKWRDFADRCDMFTDETSNIGVYPTGVNATSALTFPYHEHREGASLETISVPKFCGTNFGIIDVAGVAANVALRVRVRQVVEITAKPGTTYAPLLEAALPPDEVALRMYMEISSRMADGYPASYNDLGKLWEVIKGIGQKVLPYVEPALDFISRSGIPVASTVASVAKQAVPVVKNVVSAVKAAKQQKKNTAAAKQPTGK